MAAPGVSSVVMRRRVTAHDLADYARCPRAWWYERHEEPAALDAPALEARLHVLRARLGRRAAQDPQVRLLQRLLDRQGRLAHGRQIHDALGGPPLGSRAMGYWIALALVALGLLCLVLLWR